MVLCERQVEGMEEIIAGAVIGAVGLVFTERAFPKLGKEGRYMAKAVIKFSMYAGFGAQKIIAETYEGMKDLYAEAKYELKNDDIEKDRSEK